MREGMRLLARKKQNNGMKSQQKLECFLPVLQEIFKLFKQILIPVKTQFSHLWTKGLWYKSKDFVLKVLKGLTDLALLRI